MAILVGIDEAGYGPILGPLVVSAATFSIPDRFLEADLWELLAKSVSKKKKRLGGRLFIADSKKVYNRSVGIGHLRRTVLACLKCAGVSPANLREFFENICPDCIERLEEYPWYRNIWSERLEANEADIAIASSVLAKDLAANGAALVGVGSCCLDVAYYNQMVSNTRNKANVLFAAVLRLIKKALDNPGGDLLEVIVDRQSGRRGYVSALRCSFDNMDLRVLHEDDRGSSYELTVNGKRMRIHFIVDADERFLPVSLASMVSKYVRELLIERMNSYFVGFCEGLKPTAGYWKDGLRFIADLKRYAAHIKYETNQMIRSR